MLVDFGLAGKVDANTRGAGYTARFAAPEQMRDGISDCRSDVYSLAATIYRCLLYNDVNKRGRYKAKLLPDDCPADVRALLERCLDNDPDERPADAGAFVREWSKPKASPRPPPPREITNAIGMKLVLIPAGKFRMGSPDTERQDVLKLLNETQMPDWLKAEGPQHEVQITRPFYLSVTPVTQEQYEKVMGSNPSYFSAKGGGKDKVRGMDTRASRWSLCRGKRRSNSASGWRRCRKKSKVDARTACRRRRSGNILVEEGLLLIKSSIPSVILSPPRRPTSTVTIPTAGPDGRLPGTHL